MIQVY